jgi:hypothetical protein
MCQLDAHVPVKRISEELVPGFSDPDVETVGSSS